MKVKQHILIFVFVFTLLVFSVHPVKAVGSVHNDLFGGLLETAVNTIMNLFNYKINIEGYRIANVKVGSLQNVPLWVFLSVFFTLYAIIFYSLKSVKIFQGESARGGRITVAVALSLMAELGTTLIPNLWETLAIVSQLSYGIFILVALASIYIVLRTFFEKNIYANNANLNAIHVDNFEKNVNTTEKKIKLEKKLAKLLGKDAKTNTTETNVKTEEEAKSVEEEVIADNTQLNNLKDGLTKLLEAVNKLGQSSGNSSTTSTENGLQDVKNKIDELYEKLDGEIKRSEELLKKAENLKKSLEEEIKKYEQEIEKRIKEGLTKEPEIRQQTQVENEEVEKLRKYVAELKEYMTSLKESLNEAKSNKRKLKEIGEDVGKKQKELEKGKINLNQIEGVIKDIKNRILNFISNMLSEIKDKREKLQGLFDKLQRLKRINENLNGSENIVKTQEYNTAKVLNNDQKANEEEEKRWKGVSRVNKKLTPAVSNEENDEKRLSALINGFEKEANKIWRQLKTRNFNNKELAEEMEHLTLWIYKGIIQRMNEHFQKLKEEDFEELFYLNENELQEKEKELKNATTEEERNRIQRIINNLKRKSDVLDKLYKDRGIIENHVSNGNHFTNLLYSYISKIKSGEIGEKDIIEIINSLKGMIYTTKVWLNDLNEERKLLDELKNLNNLLNKSSK